MNNGSSNRRNNNEEEAGDNEKDGQKSKKWYRTLSLRRKKRKARTDGQINYSNAECCTNSQKVSATTAAAASSQHQSSSTTRAATNMLNALNKCLKNLKFRSKRNECLDVENDFQFLSHSNFAVSNDYVEAEQATSTSSPTSSDTAGYVAPTVDNYRSLTEDDIVFLCIRDSLRDPTALTNFYMDNFNMMESLNFRNWHRAESIGIQTYPTSPWIISPSTYKNDLILLNARILMSKYGWFRGSLTRSAAQRKLQGQPDGSFLLRNSSTKGLHFTLSFRSAGITLHYRIEYIDGYWTIVVSKYISMIDLIEDAIAQSKDRVFCFVKQCSLLQPAFPVRLTNPISKFNEVPSLQHICRYTIRGSSKPINIDGLPDKLQQYVRVNKYCNIHLDYFDDI